MSLEARIGIRLGTLALDVPLEARPGETVVLLGPNGAGKTTVLRVIAGLLALDDGRVAVDGHALDDPAVGAWVPTERRPIGYVFQDHALFPHLSALEKLVFRFLGDQRVDLVDLHPSAGNWIVMQEFEAVFP